MGAAADPGIGLVRIQRTAVEAVDRAVAVVVGDVLCGVGNAAVADSGLGLAGIQRTSIAGIEDSVTVAVTFADIRHAAAIAVVGDSIGNEDLGDRMLRITGVGIGLSDRDQVENRLARTVAVEIVDEAIVLRRGDGELPARRRRRALWHSRIVENHRDQGAIE